MDQLNETNQPYVIIKPLELTKITKITGRGSRTRYHVLFSGIEYSILLEHRIFINFKADLDKLKSDYSNERNRSGNTNGVKKENKPNVINEVKQEEDSLVRLPRKVNNPKMSVVESKSQKVRCK